MDLEYIIPMLIILIVANIAVYIRHFIFHKRGKIVTWIACIITSIILISGYYIMFIHYN